MCSQELRFFVIHTSQPGKRSSILLSSRLAAKADGGICDASPAGHKFSAKSATSSKSGRGVWAVILSRGM